MCVKCNALGGGGNQTNQARLKQTGNVGNQNQQVGQQGNQQGGGVQQVQNPFSTLKQRQ